MKTGPRIRVMLLAAGAIVIVSVVLQLSRGPRLYRTTFLPSAGPEMMPTAINDFGQVVYSERHFSDWQRRSKRLFPHRLRSRLWDPERGEIPLNRYVPAGGGDFVIQDLNNKGCIVGYIRSRDGRRSRGVLLEPIPKRWGR